MREKTRRRAGLLCLVWLLLTALPAAAAGADCALAVRYPCEGVAFRLYPVGTAKPTGGYALTGDFAAYPVSLAGLDAQGWAGAAETLEGYAARDGLEPLKTETTDESGTLTFSGLTPGLYLVSWPRHTTGGEDYTPQPFLTALPGAAGERAVTVTPKYEKTPASQDYAAVNCLVRLRWVGESYDAYRSRRVVAQLLWDGGTAQAALSANDGWSGEGEEEPVWQVYQTAELNEANGWSHDWEGLDGRYTWRVLLEDVPEGYTMTMDRDGFTFHLTLATAEEPPQVTADPGVPAVSGGSRGGGNASPVPSGDPGPSPSPAPGGSTAPGLSAGEEGTAPVPDSTFHPGVSGEGDSPSPGPDANGEAGAAGRATPTPAPGGAEDGAKPDGEKIPQTGQLWWPVPLLALAGLGLYLLGWWRSRRDGHEG